VIIAVGFHVCLWASVSARGVYIPSFRGSSFLRRPMDALPDFFHAVRGKSTQHTGYYTQKHCARKMMNRLFSGKIKPSGFTK
jgi:hypothetical protein